MFDNATELNLRIARFILGTLITALLSRLVFEMLGILYVVAFKFEILTLLMFIGYLFVWYPVRMIFRFIFMIIEEPIIVTYQSIYDMVLFFYSHGCQWFMHPLYYGLLKPVYAAGVGLIEMIISYLVLLWNGIKMLFALMYYYYYWIIAFVLAAVA